jgi:hypothetical protein
MAKLRHGWTVTLGKTSMKLMGAMIEASVQYANFGNRG